MIVSILGSLLPYLYYNRWPQGILDTPCKISGVWIDHWSRRDSFDQIYAVVDSKHPSTVIVSGELSESDLKASFLELFPYRAKTSSQENGGITILSRVPIASNYIDDLGVDAFPGGVFTLKPESCQEIELGVMALVPSKNQGDLQRNLITARRLSSLMRNSDALRIVTAQFSTTPFSAIMAIYPEQTRLRSLMYGLGIKNLFSAQTGSNVFVSREFARVSYELLHYPGRARAMQYFKVKSKEPTEYAQASIQ